MIEYLGLGIACVALIISIVAFLLAIDEEWRGGRFTFSEYTNERERLIEVITAALTTEAERRAGLRKYVAHAAGCAVGGGSDWSPVDVDYCSCGLDAALAEGGTG